METGVAMEEPIKEPGATLHRTESPTLLPILMPRPTESLGIAPMTTLQRFSKIRGISLWGRLRPI